MEEDYKIRHAMEQHIYCYFMVALEGKECKNIFGKVQFCRLFYDLVQLTASNWRSQHNLFTPFFINLNWKLKSFLVTSLFREEDALSYCLLGYKS